MKLPRYYFFALLLLLIFLTRFYRLDTFPDGLNMDEVGFGYNAYSILKTGRDEWGNFLPLAFRSVGDFKTPVLTYVMVPFVAIFGLTELAVRLPAALFSALTVILVFHLTRRFVFHKRHRHLAYLVALLLTLSPWHIFFSRLGYEALLATFFLLTNIFSLYLFLTRPSLARLWAVFLTALLTALTYNPLKLFVPLFNLLLLVSSRHTLFSWIRRQSLTHLCLTLLLLGLIAGPLLYYHVLGPGGSRAGSVFLTHDYIFSQLLHPPASASLGFLGSTAVFLQLWWQRLLQYLSPHYYISTGIPLVLPGQPGAGVLYPIEFIFLLLGLGLLALRPATRYLSHPRLTRLILYAWFVLGLLPASLANNAQHHLRNLFITPVLYIFIALGLHHAFVTLKKRHLSPLLFFLPVALFYLYGLARSADYYLVHYPQQMAEFKQHGWRQAAQFALAHQQDYDAIYIDHRYGSQGPYIYGVPHLYFLFYSRFDPATYHQLDSVKQGSSDFANFHFQAINWPEYDHAANHLYIASPWSFPLDTLHPDQIKWQIHFPNGHVALMAVADQP